MGSGVPTALAVPVYCWYAFEVALVIRDIARHQGRWSADRGTRLIVALAVVGSVAISGVVRAQVPALDTPAQPGFAVAGACVLLLGLALRVWAVVTLGRSFRTYVEVDVDQTVVTRGPYRWIRHPSYTGLLLIALGAGLGVGNWLSLAICAVVPPLGLLPRIAVEEAELGRMLGEQYRSYQARTHRLVPGLW
jgi:protein-S-isoprenylcysteine O-methyltransferase Ste14